MIRLKTLLIETIVYTTEFLEKLKKWENGIKSGWDDKKKRWYPHPSPEGGLKTIGYGHKCKTAQEQADFERTGLSEAEAVALLKSDLESAAKKAEALVPKFTSLPDTVKQALTNAAYRGEIKSTHKTVKLMNQGNWKAAASEYLQNAEYKQTKSNSIRNRMNWNYEQFLNLATNAAPEEKTDDTSQLIGKTVYPTKKNGYVNVRSQSYVDNGIIDNLDSKVMYPKPVGYIKKVVTGEDGKTWYQVVLMNKENEKRTAAE
jgi:GH24 family phage-related lysozyme (muramidase)